MPRKRFVQSLFAAGFACCLSLLTFSAPAFAVGGFRTSYAVAHGDYESGEFENALSELAAAINDTDDDDNLAKAHTLKALCYAGLGNMEAVKESFTDALEHEPAIKLDADAVSPEVVEILEKLKTTLHAYVSIKSNRPGVMIFIDGRNMGIAPLRTEVAIGVHEFELRDPENYETVSKSVPIYARKMHDVFIPFEEESGKDDDQDDFVALAESSEDEKDEPAEMDTEALRSASGERAGGRRSFFLIDLRYTFGGAFGSSPDELPDDLKLDTDLKLAGFELGLGAAGRDLMALAAVTFDGKTWGVTPKAGFHVKLVPIFGVQGSIDIPMVFPDGNFYMGAGASLGLFLRPIHLISIFVEGSYRYFFVKPSTDKLIEDESQFFGTNIWAVSAGIRFFI